MIRSFTWIKYSLDNLPLEMTKVLCFRKGDAWVAQMISYKGKDHWFPLPFADSCMAKTDPPEYWMYLDLPEGYTGRMRLRVKDSDELIEFDEFDRRHPDKHDEIAELLIASVGKCLHTPVYVNIENN
jgi:hypothetical protein